MKRRFTHRMLSVSLAILMLLLALTACQPADTPETATQVGTDAATEAPTAEETLPDAESDTETDTEISSESDTEANTEPEPPETTLHLVQNDSSAYRILYDHDDGMYAAYAFSALVASATNVEIPVEPATDSPSNTPVILLSMSADAQENTSDCGYEITAGEKNITVKAASLAGLDNAVARLLVDASAAGTGLQLPKDYAASEEITWETNYTLNGADDFKEAYLDDRFYNDKNDSVAYVLNAMYHMFTAVDDGQGIVYRFGNEPTWFEWMSEKIMWTGDTGYINELKGKLQSFAQVETGYLWSWGSYPYWRVDDCFSIHYDGTFRYISAVYDVLTWENSTDFLYAVDNDEVGGIYGSVDNSKGRTVLEKTEAAMNYILEYLHGKKGYIRLTEESTFVTPDGSKRFDYVHGLDGYCWNNTGKDGSTASNYWDNLCFGNYDAYENALFYQALNSMIGIYRMLGGEYNAKADELEALAVTVKEKYNEMYFSTDTGRYIACIDTDGRRVDFGLTFLNFEAMKYGLATPEIADSIFSWIDGTRIIEGEDRTGEDIMLYERVMRPVGGLPYRNFRNTGLKLAAVTNTVAIDNKENQKLGVAWWHGPAGINVWGSARYGAHLENGGYIFYPVFYELMARTEYLGAQSTTDRLAHIAKIYEINRLVSDQMVTGSTNWLEGLNGEFPENGLVPTAYFYGMMGVEATANGLNVSPNFNEVYEYMGVKKMTYGGKSYGLEVNRNGSLRLTCTDGVADMTLRYTPDRYIGITYTVTVTDAEGNTQTQTVDMDENGCITVTLDSVSAVSVTLTPNFN